jgi:hypothetical protein
MSKPAKVMVGMPTRGFPWVRSIIYAQELSHRLGTGLAIQVGQPVTLMRNRLVRKLLGSECTHLLMIDDDVEPPDGALERLLRLDRPVATGVYPLLASGRILASEEENGTNVGEDVWFCHRVRQSGLQIFCDGSVVCGHVKSSFDLGRVWSPASGPKTQGGAEI